MFLCVERREGNIAQDVLETSSEEAVVTYFKLHFVMGGSGKNHKKTSVRNIGVPAGTETWNFPIRTKFAYLVSSING
jgi:hypothetical protein